MHPPIGQQLGELQRLPTPQLRGCYAEVFGEHTPANNRTWLIKRIAWRLQALAEGGLSERARQRAAELANDADLRMNPPGPPRTAQAPPAHSATRSEPAAVDRRLPPPGTVLTRPYKGRALSAPALRRGRLLRRQHGPARLTAPPGRHPPGQDRCGSGIQGRPPQPVALGLRQDDGGLRRPARVVRECHPAI